MDKLKLHTPDLTAQNIEKLAALFPNCVTETTDAKGKLKRGIDFDQLRQELSDHLVEGPRERYHLDWPGKREALLAANAPIAKTLRPCREESVDFDTTKNLFIEGDNLDALKLLQETYLGKVKLIYIDPPYNTGNDFIYKDDFSADTEHFKVRVGEKDEVGRRLVVNSEANGRFHSDWLTMIHSRLKLARNLLADDGLICISIDDCERDNLRKSCDEIFGADNFVESVVWKKRYGGGAKEKHLVSLHEYVLIYARDIESLGELFVPQTQASIDRYYVKKDKNFEIKGPYRTHPLEATKSMGARPNLVFPISGPGGCEVLPKRQWLWSRERVKSALENDEIEFLKDRDGGWTAHSKQYLRDDSGQVRQSKAFSIIDSVFSQHGTNELLEIFGSAQIFPFPKPVNLIRPLLEFGAPYDDCIVLDFFAGSATTAQALFEWNAATGGTRKLILVQVPQVIDPIENRPAADFCDSINAPQTIAELTKERIRRVGTKIRAANATTAPNLDIGFRVLKIDTSNMKDVYYAPDEVKQGQLEMLTDNIKDDRTQEDLLFQVLVDWGVDLALPITQETIAKKKVFFVDGNALAACFDSNITEELVKELAKKKPLRAVFRDSSYGSDSVKINVEQIFKLLSPGTELKSL
jgi:adenine-specific DNA-methyltransferase